MMRSQTTVVSVLVIIAASYGIGLANADVEVRLSAAPANATGSGNGYTPAGRGCACKAGFGSHVPGWTPAQYPVKPPACRLFSPASDTPYNSSISFPPAGRGTGRCFCFPCPTNYTSTGGALNSNVSACTPVLPSVQLTVNYSLGMRASVSSTNSSLCGASLTNAAVRVAAKPGPSAWQLSVLLSYTASNAQQASQHFVSVANTISSDRCAYGVCSGLQAASKGSASITGAAVALRASGYKLSCSPARCDDKQCQNGTCSTGLCSYTPARDGADCTDGQVTGKCQAGVCVGMTASIKAATQGQWEKVVFHARFASTSGLKEATEVLLHGRKGNATEGIGDRLGILYDDFDRFAKDGLFVNALFIEFPKTGDAVYKSFYVSLLGQDISSPVIITAITPDFDVFVQVFPTADLVSTAQERLDEIQATITDMKPEDAAQAMYDLLLQLTGSSGRQQQLDEAAVVQMDVRNLTSVYGQIKKGTVRRVTERRVEFLTQDDLPCLILAIDDYGKSCSSRRRSRSLLHQNLGRPHLEEVLTKGNSSASGSLKKHVQQPMLQQHDQATELPGTADHSHQKDMASASSRTSNDVHAPDSTLFPARTLQQAQRCPTSRGSVLVLAPYLRENRCAFGDEAADIALLFGAAGYSVTFKCNDLGLCPAGPATLDDYVGWSRHAFVVVSTIGDDNASGETPIILSGATLDFQNTDYILDWKAGRMVLTADGRFALRPSWFQKYQDDAATNSRTVVLLSSDRSAVASGSAQEQEVRGFPGTFWGMRGSVSYAGYTGYLSLSFPAGASPGVAMARHLLAGGNVASYVGTGAADLLTGAVFKSYAYRPGATLLDRCASNCATACSNNPCGKIQSAVNGSYTVAAQGSVGAQQNFTCACQPQHTWADGACIATACSNNPCGKIQSAVNGSCTAAREGSAATTCVNRPCNTRDNTLANSCSDAAGSFSGFTCNCTVGLTWNDAITNCAVISICATSPCNNVAFAVGGSCRTNPQVPLGYTCDCQAGYVWNNNAAVCEGGPCSNPPTSPALPTNANWDCGPSGTTDNGGQCAASCNLGYVASGTTYGTCTSGGWTTGANTMLCFSSGGGGSGSGTCQNPPTSPAVPANANWDCAPSNTTAIGGQCSASCSSGYIASGTTYGTCTSGGWTTGANTLMCFSSGGGSSGSGITQGICSGGGWTIGVDFLVCSSNGSGGSGGGTCSNTPTSPALPANANWDCTPSGTTADGFQCSASCSPGYISTGTTYGTCSGGGWTTGADTLVCTSGGGGSSGSAAVVAIAVTAHA
ncbi:hypothetical protein OEZ86_010365 [Tetradesmus obliquus]|nr:hypothetical protein OEZ86_010365 [Tetradesmus obliquus]